MVLIHTIKAHQRCGAITVERDSLGRVIIRGTYAFVTYTTARTGTIDIYGLGNCGTFEINHRRYQRYIENSRIRAHNGVIFENKLRRTRFTKPSLLLRLDSTYNIKLRSIELNDVCYLRDVSPACVDAETTHFNLMMRGESRLLSGLPIVNLYCTMADTACISTATELASMVRMTWELFELDLVVEGNVRVSGVHVTRRLTKMIAPGTVAALDIGTSADCIVSNPPITDRGAQMMMAGDEELIPRYYTQNEHGMYVYAPLPEAPVPQEILDVSRAEYEQREEETTPAVHFTISGNTKLADVTSDSAEGACTICMTNKAVVIFAGCGHAGSCVQCAQEMVNYLGTCPICRSEIRTAVIPFI